MSRISVEVSKIETKAIFAFSQEFERHILKLYDLYQGGANGGAPYKPFSSAFVAKLERIYVESPLLDISCTISTCDVQVPEKKQILLLFQFLTL